MTKQLSDRAFNAELRKRYGNDCIVVHKPETLTYFITSSSNKPAATMQILRDLVKRL